jgi:ribonuclease P protein component
MRRFASLRRTADFARLRRRGRRTATPSLTVYREEGFRSDPRPLVGFTISKSVGKAVVRNTLRRRLAACIHELLIDRTQLRLLVVARPSAATLSYAALCSEMRKALG